MSSPTMLADGAGIASALDTDHVRQLLCQHIPKSLHLQGEGFSQALPPSAWSTSPSTYSTHHRYPGGSIPALAPEPEVSQTSHLSAASVESLWNATVSTKATVSQKQYGG